VREEILKEPGSVASQRVPVELGVGKKKGRGGGDIVMWVLPVSDSTHRAGLLEREREGGECVWAGYPTGPRRRARLDFW